MKPRLGNKQRRTGCTTPMLASTSRTIFLTARLAPTRQSTAVWLAIQRALKLIHLSTSGSHSNRVFSLQTKFSTAQCLKRTDKCLCLFVVISLDSEVLIQMPTRRLVVNTHFQLNCSITYYQSQNLSVELHWMVPQLKGIDVSFLLINNRLFLNVFFVFFHLTWSWEIDRAVESGRRKWSWQRRLGVVRSVRQCACLFEFSTRL